MVQGFLVVWVSRDSSIDSEFGCGVSHDSGKLREVSERRHERTSSRLDAHEENPCDACWDVFMMKELAVARSLIT